MSINPKSTAAIGDHPLHPMIIPFPVAFLVGAPIADLAFIGTGDGFWARAAIWLIGAGIVMALVAAVAGFTDFFSDARIRSLNDAWYHMIGNLVAVVLALINSTSATRKARKLQSSRGAWRCPWSWSAFCFSRAGRAGSWSTGITSRCWTRRARPVRSRTARVLAATAAAAPRERGARRLMT
jgi:uncharacterized membrane protein